VLNLACRPISRRCIRRQSLVAGPERRLEGAVALSAHRQATGLSARPKHVVWKTRHTMRQRQSRSSTVTLSIQPMQSSALP
jgi:hypothetical protein